VPVFFFYLFVLKYSLSLFKEKGNLILSAAGGTSLSIVLALMVASMSSQTFYPREGAVGMWCAIGLMFRVFVDKRRSLRESTT
jgi:hypothetical protein